MKLCIEGIRSPLTIFSNGTKGYKVHQFSIAGKEHEMLYTCLEEVLMAQNAQWEDVEAIYCIEGPGPFTALRIITLTLTALTRVHPNIQLFGLTLFEFARLHGMQQLAIQANIDEWLIADGSTWKMVSREEISGDIPAVLTKSRFENTDFFVQWEWGIPERVFTLLEKHICGAKNTLEALYLKAPKITYSLGLQQQNSPSSIKGKR